MLDINECLMVGSRPDLKRAFAFPARVVNDMIGMASVLEKLSDQLANAHSAYKYKMIELSTEFKCFTHNLANLQELNARTVDIFFHRNLMWKELELLLEESAVAFRPIQCLMRTELMEQPDADQHHVDCLCAQIFNYGVDLDLQFRFRF